MVVVVAWVPTGNRAKEDGADEIFQRSKRGGVGVSGRHENLPGNREHLEKTQSKEILTSEHSADPRESPCCYRTRGTRSCLCDGEFSTEFPEQIPQPVNPAVAQEGEYSQFRFCNSLAPKLL